ncbi:aminoacylase-1A-like protein [Neoconidiobolus thromboides FSU 785]|nr:aminoacylase-1A-like protein [Neoconidiobolus thromboides FSU 785]
MPFKNPYPAAPSNSEHRAVTNFRKYLRIKTVQPTPDYESCKSFLIKLGDELGLESKVIEYIQGKPIVILTWKGSNPSLSSIMLNSHTDVVPVFEDCWTHDPFAADKVIDKNGDVVILARGAQDMKIVGILYLEAIRELKKEGVKPLRDIHVTFVPDEEIDGFDGMKIFCKSQEFKDLNVGFALDEGISNVNDAYKVFYGERTPWKVKYTAYGNTGHGSQFIENLATDKLRRIEERISELRCREEATLKETSKFKLGDVTTFNLTMLSSGVQVNVVPQSAEAVFDIRIAPTRNLSEFRKMLEDIGNENGAKVEFISYFESGGVTSTNSDYPWWKAFSKGCEESGHNIELEVFPAATDSRYLRQIGVPAYGVSPLKLTPVLLHDHDEYVRESTVLEGLEFYKTLLPHLFNMKEGI